MSDSCQRPAPPAGTLKTMDDWAERIVDRFLAASGGFERALACVRDGQWVWPTPCAEWDVRQLVNHVTRGNLNYVLLLDGGSGGDFLRMRDADALEDDPLDAYRASVGECAGAFSRPGALETVLDYPLGKVAGRQALAVRITDTLVHTWDLAQAVGADDTLEPELVAWVEASLEQIYDGLAETPTAENTTHRFFAAPSGSPEGGATEAERLLHRMGRGPWRPPAPGPSSCIKCPG